MPHNKTSKTKKHTNLRVEVNPSFLCTFAYIFIKSSYIHIKQSHAKTPGFQSIAKFTDIVRKCQQEKLCLRLPFSSCEKFSESIIFLDYSEGSFHLNRSIHPKLYSFRCVDPLRCLTLLFGKGLGKRYLPVFILTFEAFLTMRTT